MSTGYMTPEKERKRDRERERGREERRGQEEGTGLIVTLTHVGESAGCADTQMCTHLSLLSLPLVLPCAHSYSHAYTRTLNPDR